MFQDFLNCNCPLLPVSFCFVIMPPTSSKLGGGGGAYWFDPARLSVTLFCGPEILRTDVENTVSLPYEDVLIKF